MSVGDRIRQQRKELGLTQGQLAELLDVERVTISRYESGVYEPASKYISSLAQALDCSTDFLLGNADAPNPQKESPQPETGGDIGVSIESIKERLLNEEGIMFDNYQLTDEAAILLAQSLDMVKAMAKAMTEKENREKEEGKKEKE